MRGDRGRRRAALVRRHDRRAPRGPRRIASSTSRTKAARRSRPTSHAPPASARRSAGPGTISDELVLYGAIAPDATRVRAVHARFPGVIRTVSRNVGDAVRAGDALATIESNESLQTYTVTAPIAGIVTARHAAPGEQTDADALFEIADFSSVWAELDVFSRDRARLRTGLAVDVTSDNGAAARGLRSTTSRRSATARRRASTARVVLDNADGRWTPGQFVEGRVTIGDDARRARRAALGAAALPRLRRRVRAGRRHVRGPHARRSAGATRASSRCSTASRPARPTSPTTATSSKPTSRSPARATTTEAENAHARLSRRSLRPPPLARAARRRRARRVRRLQLSAPADRRGSRHHERAGADQHGSAGLLAARGRAAHHVRDRDRDGRPAAARLHALACRATGCRRSPSCSRTAPTSTSRASASPNACRKRAPTLPPGLEPELGPDRDGSRRDLQLHLERRARRDAAPTARRTTRRICTRSWTGSCGRSSRACPASPRST